MAATGREFFTVKTVFDALTAFRPGHRTGIEQVALAASGGRVGAGDVTAPEALPGFDRSSVDGYAIRARDTFGASEAIPVYVRVVGAVRMGTVAEDPVGPQTAVAVPTGGMLPAGADAVVMIEHTQEATPGTVEVVRPVAPGENIVKGDEDVAAGATIVSAGRPLRAQDVAMLAASGVVQVDVHAAPRVTVLATGDEVVAPETQPLPPGHVRDALSASIGALIREAGGEPGPPRVIPDDRDALQQALRDAVADSDLVVICAGSSVGARDETAAAVAALPDSVIWCHGLAIKPGKPTLLAEAGAVPIIGLPGNPRSALVVFRLIGMPLLRRVGGWSVQPRAATVRARLSRDLPSAAGRLDVVQVRLSAAGADALPAGAPLAAASSDELAEPIFGPSALLSVLTAADGYLIIPEDDNGLSAGEAVDVILYG
jgi:molybdopterin molybdotransferase